MCRRQKRARWQGVLVLVALLGLVATGGLLAQSPKYGLGRAPSQNEIRQWDSSVAPDGTGLPEGSGTAAQGREVYANRCSKCHGEKGEGGDSVAVAGGQGTLQSAKPLRTVGSFWPHATTLWDYLNRAMPFKNPGVLSRDQVYAVTAYVLFLNGIVAENAVMDAKSLPKVQMPNRNGFVADPRPDVGKGTKR